MSPQSKIPRVLALSFLVLVLAAPALANNYLRVYYPDIEQGSSTLVVSPTGQALLIDAGTEIKSTEEPVVDFINDLIDAGIVTSVDYVVATHYDEDHIGSMDLVFQLVPLSPTVTTYDRGEFHQVPSTFAYADYAFGASLHNRITVPNCTTMDLGGGVSAQVFNTNGEICGGPTIDITGASQFENNASVTVLITFGDFDIWIGGDLTGNPDKGVADVESDTGPEVGDVDVYTINHHGSETSTNQNFLDSLKPEVAINQNSSSNTFGHPRAVIVNRILGSPDTNGNTPKVYQQNPGKSTDPLSDDSLAEGIADCDDTAGAHGLPGPMTLLSDGTSYQLFACNIPEITFSADSGLGTIGDYPPAIRRVKPAPKVPLATEGVTIEADVEGASSVEIRYSADGVDQTPVAMTLSTGITYTGTIPAQLDGTRVKWRVAATDAAAQTELSRAGGYFSGTTDVADLRINDADGVLVPKAYGARIEGNITAESGLFHPNVSQIFVQDATAGLQVFHSTSVAAVRGDVVEFTGEMEQFGGLTELVIADTFWPVFGYAFVSAGTVPAPEVVTVAQVGETTEGKLIRINNVSVVSGTIPETANGNVTITDDGGVSTIDIRIDGDTDIPGSSTPTQPFDVIGLSTQFDGWAPFTSGYQITPREKTDILSDEINHPQVVISEIHADPAAGGAGDANGDGVRDSTDDEFVELLNTGSSSFDISGWTLSDGTIRHTFPANTVIPPREAVVVFGGGTPTGSFGNTVANGLLFTADAGTLSLNNTNSTLILADDLGTEIQTINYGSETGDDQSIVRDPDFTNAPFVKHSVAAGSGGTLWSPGTRINGQAFTVPPGAVILTEVMYDPSGADGQLEWIELHNTTGAAIDIADMCLGSGGNDYTNSMVQLDGCTGGCTIAAGGVFVVGGPLSDANNGNPTFDFAFEFDPPLQNSDSTTADGVALFNLRCSQVDPATVPIDAVVYGPANPNNLIDETGVANAPDVADGSSGQSAERVDLAGTWQIQPVPNPNVVFPPPPPGGLVLSEVFYTIAGTDTFFEWVELYHSGTEVIDLADFSLGYGGTSWSSDYQLAGTVNPGDVVVVGGPTSDATNHNPVYLQTQDFSPDIQNSGSSSAGDGVALFNVPAAAITGSTIPIDAVVYGPDNSNGLIDETGVANAPEVGLASEGQSIERLDLAGAWQVRATPNPNSSVLAGGGNTAPSVTITAPADPSTFTEGTSINFTGTANDAEDGDLTASISWSSDLDGALGTGGSVNATLSVGTHVVTASVTDSGSLNGSDTVGVTVEAASGGSGVLLSEVYYNAPSGDDQLEWVELYNSGSSSVDLSTWCLGNGGTSYTSSKVQLSGTIAAGELFVVGGPTSSADNANPTFDQAIDFNPDFQNSGASATGDGVALFNTACTNVTGSTVPVDAVVYGADNANGLIDETGVANAPEVTSPSGGSSIERTDVAGAWQTQSSPTPNSSTLCGGSCGGGGGSPTSMHVSAMVPETVNVGGGNKKGRATVTIRDNLGNVVDGATVSGTFTGDFSESGSDATDTSGNAVIDTTATKKGSVSFTFCVDTVTHGTLTYDSSANVVGCAGL